MKEKDKMIEQLQEQMDRRKQALNEQRKSLLDTTILLRGQVNSKWEELAAMNSFP